MERRDVAFRGALALGVDGAGSSPGNSLDDEVVTEVSAGCAISAGPEVSGGPEGSGDEPGGIRCGGCVTG